MFIKRIPPNKHFTRLDNNLVACNKLSDGAFRLYCYLFSLHPGANYTDEFLMETLDLSRRSVANRKRELKDMDLLVIEQMAPRVYSAYLGTFSLPASSVREIVKKHDKVFEKSKRGDDNE